MAHRRTSPIPPPGTVSPGPTTPRVARKGERPGSRPVFQNIGAVSAAQISRRILAGPWTDPKPATSIRVRASCQNVIASTHRPGAGDGIRQHEPRCDQRPRMHASHARARPAGLQSSARFFRSGGTLSHTAIAAALALVDVSPGERLVALSLASYANRENHAWPARAAAAARAGLSRGRYLHARDRLVRRGLLAIEDAASGRGRSTTVLLAFAETGARYEGPINPALFEAVLSRSDARGPARQLLAAAAALADDRGVLEGLTTAELREAAGLADSTYRRARTALLGSGELVLEKVARGRGNTNRWEVRDPRAVAAHTAPHRSLAKHPPNARPLLATILPPSTDAQAPAKPAHDGTRSAKKGPVPGGISRPKPARSRTVPLKNPPESPPESPPENPPENRHPTRARQGNLGTRKSQITPPAPLPGGATPTR